MPGVPCSCPVYRTECITLGPVSGCGDRVCAILMSVGKCWRRAKLPATPPRSTQTASESFGVPNASACRGPLPLPDDGPKLGQDALQILMIGGYPLWIALPSEAATRVRPTLGHGGLEAQRLLCLRPALLVLAGRAVPPVRGAAVQTLRRRSKEAPAPPTGALHASPSSPPIRGRRPRCAAVRAGPRRRTAIPTVARCTFRTRRLAVASVRHGWSPNHRHSHSSD